MNPIWRVTMEMSKSRSENQKMSKKRREIQRDKTRKEKEERRLEALERDRERFIVGQEHPQDGLERYEELEDIQESAAEKFQKELCWCIQQTKVGLANIKPSSNEAKPQAEEAHKLLRILTSSKAPMAKKRQVMRAMFGDYRSKMQQEERRHKADMSKRMCLEPVCAGKQGSGTFYRISNSASSVPSSKILSTNSDLPGEAGPSGRDPRSAGHRSGLVNNNEREGEEGDVAMQELERRTEGMHMLNLAPETGSKFMDHDMLCQSDVTRQSVAREQKCLNQDGGSGTSAEIKECLNRSESEPFLFNFDISDKDLDRNDTRLKGSNKNIEGSLSENSTPEKGPSGGRKKSGSRRRNRAKKKQQSIIRDKEATVAVNQAAIVDNQSPKAATTDERDKVADNQTIQLEAEVQFRFDFPEPVEQAVTP